MASIFRRRPHAPEIFVLNGLVSLILAAVWLALRHRLLLEYFYFAPLLALTHLVTLGVVSSLKMGVLYRLSPTLLKIAPASNRVATWQLGFFLVGSWGMIAHFWLSEWTGMSWSAFLVWAAAMLQLWNFRGLLRFDPRGGDAAWARGFVAASLVYFVLAASLGVLLGLLKAYDLRPSFFAPAYLDNLFAHAHLAGVGFVTMMVFGFQLKLVPTTVGALRSLPWRFALMQVGLLGLAGAFLFGWAAEPFAVSLALGCFWQTLGPLEALWRGRAREWELVPLLSLALAAGLGLGLAFGAPEEPDLRARVQLAYGWLALFGFMILMIVTTAFKLFPMWVWKERFQSEFGKKPVPGMKELHSEPLRRATNLGMPIGVACVAAGIVAASPLWLALGSVVVVAAVLGFVFNLARVLRFAFLAAEFHPSATDERKFEEMFVGRSR